MADPEQFNADPGLTLYCILIQIQIRTLYLDSKTILKIKNQTHFFCLSLDLTFKHLKGPFENIFFI